MKTALISLLTFTLCLFNLYSQAAGDFRTVATGNWNVVSTWERFDGTSWITPAPSTPIQSDGVITIQTGHTVTVPAAVTMDQVIINGTLQNNAGIVITIGNSASPPGSSEFVINGTFIENGAASTVWNAGATWNFGANGTYVKTNATNSNNWQLNYEGGAATMPSTANWIIRRNSAVNPTLSTTPLGPGIGAYYPNLTIENNVAGTWTTPAASCFPTTATSAYAVIKGNLNIGGTGTGNVIFLNGQLFTGGNSTLVQGNVFVKAASTLQNFGNGLEIQGDLTVNGTLTYNGGTGNSNLIFSGSNTQSISIGGGGVLAIKNFQVNKPANTLTLNNPITIDNVATFTSGIVNSTITNLLILNTNATTTGANNLSFVNGPVRYLGGAALVYPVGKVASYRPISIGSGTAGTFWTEPFQSTCSSACLATGYVGPNGAWTITATGTNGAASNNWYVSGSECGNAAGNCGSACGTTDASLYVSSNLLSGGLGAAYNATGATNVSNRRVESPIIDFTGKSNVQLNFNFIGRGQSCVTDFCDLELSTDGGTSWITLQACMTSALCAVQGRWTAFSITLPASTNNNPNVKIGFRWSNNGDGVGTDPSFAVDDISLNIPTSFTAEYFPTNPQVPYGNVLVPTLTALSDCEYWILNRDIGNESRIVSLSWNAATCYNTAFASFEVARWDNISGIWQDHNGIVAGTAAGGTVTTPAVVTSFSPFAIAYVPLPLPVEMENISVKCEDGSAVLQWQTASEINNDHFSVERSHDAITWEEIGRVTGSGNSNTHHSYSWVDDNPIGNGYYRIKQFDYNGDYKTFDPLALNCTSSQDWINVYPNPSGGSINVEISSGSHLEAIMVYSSLGQFTSNLDITSMKDKLTLPVDISFLDPGTYYLRLLVNGHWITKPVVIIK